MCGQLTSCNAERARRQRVRTADGGGEETLTSFNGKRARRQRDSHGESSGGAVNLHPTTPNRPDVSGIGKAGARGGVRFTYNLQHRTG